MESKSFRISRVLLIIATSLVLLFGMIAVFAPNLFTATDFRTTTGQVWAEYQRAEPDVARYVRGETIELGSLFLCLGTFLTAILLFAYKPGAHWAWWAILFGSTLAGAGDTISLVHQHNLPALSQIGLVMALMYAGLLVGRKSIFRGMET